MKKDPCSNCIVSPCCRFFCKKKILYTYYILIKVLGEGFSDSTIHDLIGEHCFLKDKHDLIEKCWESNRYKEVPENLKDFLNDLVRKIDNKFYRREEPPKICLKKDI